jgi:hypothetical protein
VPARPSGTSAPSHPIVPGTAPPIGLTSSPLAVGGTILNAVTNYPLPGLTVSLLSLEAAPAGDESPPAETPLGSSVSSGSGDYQITWIDSPLVSQRVCTLVNCPDSQFILKVEEPGRTTPLYVSPATSPRGNSTVVNLLVTLPQRAVTATNWRAVGRRLQGSGFTKLTDLIRQLTVVPPAASLFADWSVSLKQNAVAQLESAFLDPTGTLGKITPVPSWHQLTAPGGLDAYRQALGTQARQARVVTAFTQLTQKVSSFPSISAVDWIINPAGFGDGPAPAITAHQNEYFGPSQISEPSPVDLGQGIGYRDYLRTQWTTAVTLIAQPATTAQAEEQLYNRFHQDFHTTDTTPQAANEVLIPVLTQILTAPAGTSFGFGVAAAAIPARGAASPRQYLDTLIALSGVSAQELTLRYRTDFTRPDTAMSDAVWENIHTLQGFFRDSFQSVADPADANPDVLGQPIIPNLVLGKAPFFLEYEEWLLLQQPIPFENYFQIRQIFDITISDDTRTAVQNAASAGSHQQWFKLVAAALKIQDGLNQAYQYLDQNEYRAALDIFTGLQLSAEQVLSTQVIAESLLSGLLTVAVDVVGNFSTRRSKLIHSLDDLNDFVKLWHLDDDIKSVDPLVVADTQTKLACSLVYLALFTLPAMSAQCALALGDYPAAVFHAGRSAFLLVGKGPPSDTESAYRTWQGLFELYHAGGLPYTADTENPLLEYPDFTDDDSPSWLPSAYVPGAVLQPFVLQGAADLIPARIHPVESLFFRLQMGNAMLEWADQLYRTDDNSSISRARELYKGVYFLHGDTPPINPTWTAVPVSKGIFFGGTVNPARVSQLARAQRGFTQINVGLNFFGYADDMVPVLRYATLKAAADAFSSEAKSTERDFIDFIGQLENATIENMKNAAMFRRANLQAKIADQQAGSAQDQIQQAQIVIAQVNQQIAAVQQQIADHNSFWGQVGDYMSGMVGQVKGMLDFTNAAAPTVGAVAGISTEDVTAFSAANAGALGLAGFGAFAVVSYMTMSSMEEAGNQRATQLANLQGQALPAAQAQLDIAKRSSAIADLNKQIAEVDAQLAIQLLSFAQERYLTSEFWSYMASLMQRLMRQFVDLATRMGWLAERALAYEQNSDIRIMLMDYLPAQQQGAGGADRLQADLAALEAQHLDGMREMLPVKHAISIARDFPLQFGQLLTTGRCTFQTSEQSLQLAYPGTFAYRIVAVTPTLTQAAARSPVRGLLSNTGISQIGASDGSMNLSVRAADALPISEFNLGTTDMAIWGLPGGTLMQFEGSGVNTIWTLEFPAAANPSGLGGLADILITLDLRAQFAQDTYERQLQAMPKAINKLMFISALKQKVSGLADLQSNAAKATIAFDLTGIGLPGQERNRRVTNLAFLVVGRKSVATIKAKVISATPSRSIPVTFANGTVFSNAPPITDAQSTVAQSALNVLKGARVDQTFSLEVDRNANPGVDFAAVQDVLLGVDYSASI